MKSTYFDHFNSQNFGTTITHDYVGGDGTRIHLFINGDMEAFFTKFFMNGMTSLFNSETELKTMYMDFGAVKYVSSSFIANLLQIIHKAGQTGIDIFFLNPNSSLLTMIDSMGLAHFVRDVDLSAGKAFTILCRNCGGSVSVPRTGNFSCPHCGASLHFEKKGAVGNT